MAGVCPQKIVWQPLRSTRQFAAVMQQGRIVAKSAHFSLHALRLPEQHNTVDSKVVFVSTAACLVGMLLSKRWAAKAVRRNLIKRQIRSVLHQYAVAFNLPHSHIALVVRLHNSWDKTRFVSAASDTLRVAVRQELLELLQHAQWHKAPVFT